jgi:hypothetical protein
MKRSLKITVLMVAFAAVLFACNSKPKATEVAAEQQTEAQTIVQILENAENLVEKEVYITGMVNHVCKHSGKRCFITDSTGENSIRIEAGGELGGFNKELSGSTITAKGILKERRLLSTEIDELESKTLEEIEKAEVESDHCSAEMNNIKQMREWMKAHNKDYYAIYYIDGLEYEVSE